MWTLDEVRNIKASKSHYETRLPLCADDVEEDISAAAAFLQPSLSSVTHLAVHLKGDAHDCVGSECCNGHTKSWHDLMATTAVSVLAPLCSPLQTITLSNELESWKEETYCNFLDAVKEVCSSSLTHLSFSTQQTLDTTPPQIDTGLATADSKSTTLQGCGFTLQGSCHSPALQS